MMILPRLTGLGRKSGDKKHTPIERAKDTAGVSYESQINQAIMLYKQDNEERNPPDLKALKTYGVTDEMVIDQVTKLPLPYNPTTGTVGVAAQTAPIPTTPGGPTPRRNVGPGGVSLPNIPQPPINAGDNE